MNKKVLVSLFLLLSSAIISVRVPAAVVNNGDRLGIATTGSYFALDVNQNNFITTDEKIALLPGPDGGIIIGAIQPASGSHSGPPDGSETSHIDIPWDLQGSTGMFFTVSAVTGDTVSGLDFTGWRVTWNDIVSDLGNNAWNPSDCAALGCTGHTFVDGVAWFRWDGVYGHSYLLDYTGRVSELLGFETPGYYLHLEGTVLAAPVPAAAWLFASGLMGMLVMTRRRKTTGFYP